MREIKFLSESDAADRRLASGKLSWDNATPEQKSKFHTWEDGQDIAKDVAKRDKADPKRVPERKKYPEGYGVSKNIKKIMRSKSQAYTTKTGNIMSPEQAAKEAEGILNKNGLKRGQVKKAVKDLNKRHVGKADGRVISYVQDGAEDGIFYRSQK